MLPGERTAYFDPRADVYVEQDGILRGDFTAYEDPRAVPTARETNDGRVTTYSGRKTSDDQVTTYSGRKRNDDQVTTYSGRCSQGRWARSKALGREAADAARVDRRR